MSVFLSLALTFPLTLTLTLRSVAQGSCASRSCSASQCHSQRATYAGRGGNGGDGGPVVYSFQEAGQCRLVGCLYLNIKGYGGFVVEVVVCSSVGRALQVMEAER